MEKLKSKTRKWEKYGKVRLYFNNGYLKSANAYFTTDETDTTKPKYKFSFGEGWICSDKCYNGCVQDEIKELEV